MGTLKRVIQTQGAPPTPAREDLLPLDTCSRPSAFIRLPGLQLGSACVSKRATHVAFTSASASVLRGPWTDFSSFFLFLLPFPISAIFLLLALLPPLHLLCSLFLPSTNSSVQQIFLHHFLGDGHCSRQVGSFSEKNKDPCLRDAYVLVARKRIMLISI